MMRSRLREIPGATDLHHVLHIGSRSAKAHLALYLRPHSRYFSTYLDTHLYFLTINLVNIAISLIYNGVMYFIYTRKIPFL